MMRRSLRRRCAWLIAVGLLFPAVGYGVAWYYEPWRIHGEIDLGGFEARLDIDPNPIESVFGRYATVRYHDREVYIGRFEKGGAFIRYVDRAHRGTSWRRVLWLPPDADGPKK